MTHATIYGRFSPRPDAETSESNRLQLELSRAYCQRKGYCVAHEFDDPDASGDDENRTGLWDAINSLKRGMVLVVWKMDRLCRSVYLSEFIHREVAKRGARIEAVEGQTRDDTLEGVLIRQVLAAFDEYAKKMGAARTSAFMRQHQRNGRVMSANTPYGWREIGVVDGRRRMEPDPREQRVVARIRTLHAQGLTPHRIARRLNQERVACRGSEWRGRRVAKILEREVTSSPPPGA